MQRGFCHGLLASPPQVVLFANRFLPSGFAADEGQVHKVLVRRRAVPADHPLRTVRALTGEALRSMSRQLERLYSKDGSSVDSAAVFFCAVGRQAREAASWMLAVSAPPGSTVGADKGYDVARFRRRAASHRALVSARRRYDGLSGVSEWGLVGRTRSAGQCGGVAERACQGAGADERSSARRCDAAAIRTRSLVASAAAGREIGAGP